MYISRRTIWIIHLMIVPAFICLKLRDWYPEFSTGWFILLMSIVLPTICYCVWHDEKEERERHMRWFFLTHDMETGVWTQKNVAEELPKDVEFKEYVWRYDGAVIGADVMATNLEEAIEKAQRMAAEACRV